MKVLFTITTDSLVDAGVLEEYLQANDFAFTATVGNGKVRSRPRRPSSTRRRGRRLTDAKVREIKAAIKKYPDLSNRALIEQEHLGVGPTTIYRIRNGLRT